MVCTAHQMGPQLPRAFRARCWALLAAAFSLNALGASGPPVRHPLRSLSPAACRHQCVFDVQGQAAVPAATGAVTTQSVPASATLASATISCSSQDGSLLTLYGGSMVAAFADSFSGVDFQQDLSLPGPTMFINDSSLEVTASSFDNVGAKQSALLVLQNSTLVMSDTIFSNNVGSIAGAIQGMNSSISLQDSMFLNNSATFGGAVAMVGGGLSVFNCTFFGNSGSQGGAVSWVNGTTASLQASQLIGNSASASGGALYVQNCQGSLSLAGSEVTYNTASQNGGGIFQQQCNGAVTDTDFKHNSAPNGGAAFLNAFSALSVLRSNFTLNSATTSAGGLQVQSVVNATVQGCIFNGNVGSKGAGLYLGSVSGTFSLNYFLANQATGSGGGFFRTAGTGSITNSQFVNNAAAANGGAIYDSQGTGDISGNVFSGNSAKQGSTIYRDSCSGSVLTNTGLVSSAVTEVNAAGSTGASSSSSSTSSSSQAIPSLWGR